MKILAIGAHPDDIEVGCAGTFLYFKKKCNAEIYNYVMTFGEANEDLRIRFEEQEKSDEIIGVNSTFYGTLPDTEISLTSAIDKIEKALGDINPTHIFTHTLEDTHQDHRTLYEATIAAGRNHPNIIFYESYSTLSHLFSPSLFVDIGDFWERKYDAVESHETQCERLGLLEYVGTRARYWAHRTGCRYIEAFGSHKFIWS